MKNRLIKNYFEITSNKFLNLMFLSKIQSTSKCWKYSITFTRNTSIMVQHSQDEQVQITVKLSSISKKYR